MVIDAFGVTAEVGMKVAFGHGGRGAQPFAIGEIVSIGPKTVRIAYTRKTIHWHTRKEMESLEHFQRPNGAFVVQL
ncbi:hypothetical protein Loshitsa2_00029 [Erwinia phage Loshitsa2]|uniref:Uncharacterized protein n=1 Tax=Erwinia phage Loshitsa2 TaxID=2923254 RepID=A0AAE9JVD5_9CAUD|nr:hypothetical protein Loshitsa2_00029 [Erwinia phage Loshitsa2]